MLNSFHVSESLLFDICPNGSMHHYECIALCKDINLQRGRFCAISLASYDPRSSKDRNVLHPSCVRPPRWSLPVLWRRLDVCIYFFIWLTLLQGFHFLKSQSSGTLVAFSCWNTDAPFPNSCLPIGLSANVFDLVRKVVKEYFQTWPGTKARTFICCGTVETL